MHSVAPSKVPLLFPISKISFGTKYAFTGTTSNFSLVSDIERGTAIVQMRGAKSLYLQAVFIQQKIKNVHHQYPFLIIKRRKGIPGNDNLLESVAGLQQRLLLL